jgi:hypothetical protein
MTFEEIQSALDLEQELIRQLAQQILVHTAMLEQLRCDLQQLTLVNPSDSARSSK